MAQATQLRRCGRLQDMSRYDGLHRMREAKLAAQVRAASRTLLFSIALGLLLFPATANAKNCFMVDYENAPAATVSGRITAHHRAPKGSELRAADGPFLNLDTPLLTADAGDTDQCLECVKIVIMSHDDDLQLAKWTNQHVLIFGQFSRLGSALVDPAIFIKAKTIKKGSLPPSRQRDPVSDFWSH